jgi:ribonuclease P protein subunit POP4
MKVTPDIVTQEFLGTDARVARSSHENHVGIRGRIVDETRNTFKILHDGKAKTVAKDSSVFHFRLQDGTIVEIEGSLLVGRPEDRLKKCIRRLW